MEALSTLPTTLQDMYARTLDTLQSSNCYREALFMLQYVLWAREPPLFSEMIDAVAVRLDESPAFKQENRLFELMDVITHCSILLTPISLRRGRAIHLAHSSVNEYLRSQQLVEPFKSLLSEFHARSTIAKISMRYMIDLANLHNDSIKSSGKPRRDLLLLESSEVVLSGNHLGRLRLERQADNHLAVIMDKGAFPFLWSAGYWAEHSRVVEAANDDIPGLVLQLYKQEPLLRDFPQILGLGFLYHHGEDEYMHELYIKVGHTPDPLIHACCWGLELVAQQLLKDDAHLITSSDIDSPLHAASLSGHRSIVKMLLDKGAPVDGCVRTSFRARTIPLHGASRNGHTKIARTLLKHGASFDVLGWNGETAIELAVAFGHKKMVKLLMKWYDCLPFHLLFVALDRGPVQEKMVNLLCSKPIVPDDQTSDEEFRRLLTKLMRRGQLAYAKMLLEKGTYVHDPEYKLGRYQWPESPDQEQLQIAKMLLDRGVVLPDDLVQRVKLSVEKEFAKPEERPSQEDSQSADHCL